MTGRFAVVAAIFMASLAAGGRAAEPAPAAPWPAEKAWQWYSGLPWLVGFNYVPSTACNTTEWWQRETYDAATIDRELGWAAGLGFNTTRVFLQYLVWKEDRAGFKERFTHFLSLAEKHGISVMPVLFDDCAFGEPPQFDPVLGRQREPIPGMVLPSWTPSPGRALGNSPAERRSLEAYVVDLLAAFGKDRRVIAWDLFNEPMNVARVGSPDLLREIFAWARRAGAEQPLTIGVWGPGEIEPVILENSDIVTFHCYGTADRVRQRIDGLRQHGRPVIATEWMARLLGSRWQTDLPLFRDEAVGCYCWGLVNGRTQAQFSWMSKPGSPEPEVWFHDLLHSDGRPYDPRETDFLRQYLAARPRLLAFAPFVWPSDPPAECPFPASPRWSALRFTGKASDYRFADTWYPTWAEDGNLYSPFTDGAVGDDLSISDASWQNQGKENARTGQAVLAGDDPLSLKVTSLGMTRGHPGAYDGRYPCGSLVHNGVWYYGTYCLGPKSKTEHEGFAYNWPVIGPMPGFRISRDYGRTWRESPHTPDRPLFPEPAEYLGPVKIGSPHFVDFGRNMQHSPDGKAYLVAHGSEARFYPTRFANNSWITGDQVYLLRVTPSEATINDLASYEFFAGHDAAGQPVWSQDFAAIKPLLEWQNNMGCVTVTYNAPLKTYFMCVTDGWPTVAKMNSYLLEAEAITGPWRLVTYMRHFGEQAYFLNLPSKFISADGRRMWLCYSANFATDWNGETIRANPPGSRYGLVLQEVALVAAAPAKK
jgi:hypothetical protein